MLRVKTIQDILIDIEDTYHLTQIQVSKRMGVSTQYVSAVKSGSKSMSKTWIKKIQELFPDCEFTEDQLRTAYELSKEEVSFPIKNASRTKKVMALKMSNKFEDLTDEQSFEILEILE